MPEWYDPDDQFSREGGAIFNQKKSEGGGNFQGKGGGIFKGKKSEGGGIFKGKMPFP
jgi:hypothetical protein